jgi:hypothetical protein
MAFFQHAELLQGHDLLLNGYPFPGKNKVLRQLSIDYNKSLKKDHAQETKPQ